MTHITIKGDRMTHTKDAALKLALEAAEDFADVIKYDDIGRKACCDVLSYHPHSESCKASQAITAIKAALAQQAQEPVAVVTGKFTRVDIDLPIGTPLYTTPPAQPAQEQLPTAPF